MWPWRRRSDDDFADEIRANIAIETDRLIASGMVPADARRAALRAFGNATGAQERFYESRRILWLDDLRRDVWYACRTLARNPVFAAVVVATLGVGIGAGTVVYTFARAVIFRPLPYAQPDELVRIFETNPLKKWTRGIDAAANYADWRTRNAVFTDMAAYQSFEQDAFLAGEGDSQPLRALGVTGNLFRVLGVAPALGRTFTDQETFDGSDRVVVLSYGTWRQLFSADPGVIGRKITLSGVTREVVGVMPPDFFFPGRNVQIWQPLGFAPSLFVTLRRPHSLNVVARRKPGVTLEQARADMDGIATALERQYPDTNTKMGVRLESFHGSLAFEPQPALVLLGLAVGLLFLIVCTNIASLQLGRALAREHEFETRRALGAGRGRIVRQVLAESLVISVGGGAIGLGLAALATPALVHLAASEIPSFADVRLDRTVVLAAVLLAIAAPAICGLVPALASAGFTQMKVRGGSASRRSLVLRNLLVAAETSLSIVLVVGSVLLVRSMIHLTQVDPGFDPARAVTFTLTLPPARYQTAQATVAAFTDIEDRIRQQPGVEAVGASSSIALHSFTWTGDATVEGRAPDDYERELRHSSITPDYFKAMRIRILSGRTFDDRDRYGQPLATVVNEALVRGYLRGRDPLSSRIKFGRPQDNNPWIQIVGVVADEKQDGMDKDAQPTAYSNIAQAAQNPMTFVVRTPLEPGAALDSIRGQVHAVDRQLALTSVATLRDVVDESLGGFRFRTALLSSFAAIALLLAALGTYGMLAYVVSQRSRELGIRLALGAPRPSLFRLVVAQGMRPVLAGAFVGLFAAVALARLMQSLTFGVGALDPVTYAFAFALLGGVGVCACALPAWRAMRVDPVVALRCE